jgi:hypothetical protein
MGQSHTPLKRRQVGDAERYHGRRLHAAHMGPDLLSYVDDVELGGFYLNVEAALAAGRRYVDGQIKEEKSRK